MLENTVQDLDGFEQPKENQVGTWITTTPSGIRVGTEGAKQMDLEPLLIYHATDPADGTVLIFLCYSYLCVILTFVLSYLCNMLRERAAII